MRVNSTNVDQYNHTTGTGTDTTAPTLSSISPTDTATGVSPVTKVVLTFSEEIDPLTTARIRRGFTIRGAYEDRVGGTDTSQEVRSTKELTNRIVAVVHHPQIRTLTAWVERNPAGRVVGRPSDQTPSRLPMFEYTS